MVFRKTLSSLVLKRRERNERDEDWLCYSIFSQSIKDSWSVSSFTHVPTKNGKSLTPFLGAGTKWDSKNEAR